MLCLTMELNCTYFLHKCQFTKILEVNMFAFAYIQVCQFCHVKQFYFQVQFLRSSLVSPIVCNLYMETFEKIAFPKAENPPHWWKRYVYIPYCKRIKHIILQTTVGEYIEWMIEGEVGIEVKVEGLGNRMERGLAFLDTLSVISEDGPIKTRVGL